MRKKNTLANIPLLGHGPMLVSNIFNPLLNTLKTGFEYY